jgi:hypothetical protein
LHHLAENGIGGAGANGHSTDCSPAATRQHSLAIKAAAGDGHVQENVSSVVSEDDPAGNSIRGRQVVSTDLEALRYIRARHVGATLLSYAPLYPSGRDVVPAACP